MPLAGGVLLDAYPGALGYRLLFAEVAAISVFTACGLPWRTGDGNRPLVNAPQPILRACLGCPGRQ